MAFNGFTIFVKPPWLAILTCLDSTVWGVCDVSRIPIGVAGFLVNLVLARIFVRDIKALAIMGHSYTRNSVGARYVYVLVLLD